jgi:cbb3-type cytochrome oxidase subunit 3
MLSQGIQQYFTGIPMTVVGLLIFFITFSAIGIWTFFRANSKEYYQNIAQLPLREGERHE